MREGGWRVGAETEGRDGGTESDIQGDGVSKRD